MVRTPESMKRVVEKMRGRMLEKGRSNCSNVDVMEAMAMFLSRDLKLFEKDMEELLDFRPQKTRDLKYRKMSGLSSPSEASD